MPAPEAGKTVVLDRPGLDRLVDVLIAEGYRVIGPTVRDNAIVLAELDSAQQLPAGWGVETGPGHYRLQRRNDEAVFAHSAGPQGWKQFLHPPRRKLWSAGRGGGFTAPEPDPARYASWACGAATSPRSRPWAASWAGAGTRTAPLLMYEADCS